MVQGEEDDDEFGRFKDIDLRKITPHNTVLASAAIATARGSCRIGVGMLCRTFAKPVDLWRLLKDRGTRGKLVSTGTGVVKVWILYSD
jgi:hypothetical protein